MTPIMPSLPTSGNAAEEDLDSATTKPKSPMEVFALGPFTVPRIWTGLWQLSSNAWGSTSAAKIRRSMARYAESGFIAFADHYGSAELIFGQFLQSQPPASIVGATKWCVFRPTTITREFVEAAVRERMSRMRSSRVDLLQLHWQDYSNPDYLTSLHILRELQEEGLIAAIGLCNFDAIRTDEICTQLGPGVIVSNQVQFSLIDTRPLDGMADVCERHNVKLLTYGTLCGGFLADKWLNQPEPDLYSGNLTPSQRKYLDIILNAWASWDLFQCLLRVLRNIGDRYRLSIANVAVRWVLDHPFVGAILIGTRLGVSEHLEDNQKVFKWNLSDEDNRDIENVLKQTNSRKMISSMGDCGAEYR